jgi:hypothetical protein
MPGYATLCHDRADDSPEPAVANMVSAGVANPGRALVGKNHRGIPPLIETGWVFNPRLIHLKDRCALQPSLAQTCERFVGFFQRKGLGYDAERCLRYQLEEFLAITPGEVGH